MLRPTTSDINGILGSSRSARASAHLYSNDLQPSLTVQSPRRSSANGINNRRYSADSYSQPKSSDYAHRHSLDTASTRSPSSSAFAQPGRLESHSPALSSSTPIPRPPKKESDSRSTHSRDSVCDSLYEPLFTIPSATALRRKKMARVCKLLGDGVPVELVFPCDQPEPEVMSDDVVEHGRSFLDVRPESPSTESLSTLVTPEDYIHISRSCEKPLPKRPSFRESAQSTRTLAPIRERLSIVSDALSSDSDDAPGLSHGSSVESLFSTLHTDDESPAPSTPVTPAREPPSPFSFPYGSLPVRQAVSKSSGRREFSMYVPRRTSYVRHHRRGSSGSDIVRTKLGSQELEFEIVRGVTDLQL